MVAGQDALLAQMRRGTLQYCVLALLTAEERYGFDLVKALAEMDGMVTSEGTIYPLLSRLRRDGLVETTWRESPTGPPRRYYSLTDRGRAALEVEDEAAIRTLLERLGTPEAIAADAHERFGVRRRSGAIDVVALVLL